MTDLPFVVPPALPGRFLPELGRSFGSGLLFFRHSALLTATRERAVRKGACLQELLGREVVAAGADQCGRFDCNQPCQRLVEAGVDPLEVRPTGNALLVQIKRPVDFDLESVDVTVAAAVEMGGIAAGIRGVAGVAKT